MSNSPTISAISHEGLSVIATDGRPAKFAIVDEDGNVLATGKEIADAAWQASVNAYRQFLMGHGPFAHPHLSLAMSTLVPAPDTSMAI